MPPKLKSLSPQVLQTWALANETMRSIPLLGVILAVIALEQLARSGVISPEAATGLKLAIIATEVLGTIGVGGAAAGGAAGGAALASAGGAVTTALALSKGTAAKVAGSVGLAGASVASIPVLPAVAIAATLAGTALLSHASAKVISAEVEKVADQFKRGELTEREATGMISELMIPILPG